MTKQDFDTNVWIWKKLFCMDDKTIGALYSDIVKRNAPFNKKLLMTVNPCFVKLVSLFERTVTPKHHKKFDSIGNDFVFITCVDPIHRVKTLSLLAGELKFTKFFLPSITRPMVVRKYFRFYVNNTNEKVFFGVFSSEDIKKYQKFLKDNRNIIKTIKCENTTDALELKYHLMRYALYSIYSKRMFANIDHKCVWLFEHDKFFFIPIIEQFHKKNIATVQLQHGTFFNPNTAVFLPLYTDKVLCCSNREKKLYLEGGVEEEDVYVVGAPLQTIGNKTIKLCDTKYDILVLLTASSIGLSIMKDTLNYLNEHYSDKRVLLRFRPRSKDIDKAALSNFIYNFTISEGSSLIEDINTSDKVLSLSEDANFELIRAGKKFVCIVDPSNIYGKYLDGICFPIQKIDEGINFLMDPDKNVTKDHYIENYGETDVPKISQNFISIIRQI